MNVITVESSTLAALAYDDGREILQLEFRSGATYQYFAVPLGVLQDLLAAESKGTYFNRSIRDQFQHQRLA